MKATKTGGAKVYLIASPNKCYSDIAAKFCRSTKSVEDIISSDYNQKMIQTIVDSGHFAALEFDYWIFGIEDVSRVFEAQLIRKRMASYMVSSGREEHKNWELDMVLPDDPRIPDVTIPYGDQKYNIMQIMEMVEKWYLTATKEYGISSDMARYFTPQGSKKKIVYGANSHALLDWFKIRCCERASFEIRDVAWKILKICKKESPDIFKLAGPSCVSLGYCPEMEQPERCKTRALPSEIAKECLKEELQKRLSNHGE